MRGRGQQGQPSAAELEAEAACSLADVHRRRAWGYWGYIRVIVCGSGVILGL